jgi:hypothetical protein
LYERLTVIYFLIVHATRKYSMKPNGSPLLSGAFVFLAVAVACGFAGAVGLATARTRGAAAGRRAAAMAAVSAGLWMAATWATAASGLLAQFERRPPPFFIVIAASLGLGLALGRSRVGEVLARGLPVAALVGAQVFRLGVELVLHEAAREGVMPRQMTWTGANFDVLTGATAPLLALLLARRSVPHRWVAAWNLAGAALLANVLVVAVRSSPMVHAFGTEPSNLNTFVAYPPFVWLPTVLVVAALLLHVVIARRVLADAKARATRREIGPSLSATVTRPAGRDSGSTP